VEQFVKELAVLAAGLFYHGYDFSVFQTPSLFSELKNIFDSNNIDYL